MRRIWAAFIIVQAAVPLAWGWGAQVHRMVTQAALEGLPPAAPEWLRSAEVRERAAFESNQPDRWRGWNSVVLKHTNDPDHYIDVEDLDQFGLTLDTLPKLRMEYVRVCAVAKVEHPERMAPYDAAKDDARAHEWPGFVLHAAAEQYAKLQAAFLQVLILEKLNDPARAAELAEARAIVIYHLGALSHFIGDIAQPLHTSRHFNGWVGENPAGYKWRDKFHAYVDEGWAKRHGVTVEGVRTAAKFERAINAADPWTDLVTYLKRSHAELEPLYALERDGKLDGDEGKSLITRRLGDAAGMLEGLIQAAYTSAQPTDKQVESWVHYDDNERAAAPSRPAGGGR